MHTTLYNPDRVERPYFVPGLPHVIPIEPRALIKFRTRVTACVIPIEWRALVRFRTRSTTCYYLDRVEGPH